MAVICGMFRLLFIGTAIDRDVAIGNVAAPGCGERRPSPSRLVHLQVRSNRRPPCDSPFK